MSQKILVTNYKFNVSPEDFEQMAIDLAPTFNEVPGCLWKIWLIDRDKKEAGAVYLFQDQESLDTFKASPLVASILSHPALSNFDLKDRDILVDVSLLNHAPLHAELMQSA